ncbi:MAG: sulfide-dependent adenosine diphosphate thiazole synthase [bacterium]
MVKFYPVNEAKITRAIADDFYKWFNDYVESDVIIVGGGPSGLLAAHDLAGAGLKTLVIESNNYLGGGFWVGGYLMNTLTFRAPGQEILRDLDIPYSQVDEGLFIADGPRTCAKLIAAACDAGARILNLTKVEDVLYKNGRVQGVVINWTAISSMPRAITCLDPVTLESKVVIDATGHDAHVCRSLQKRGLLKMAEFGPMDVQSSEDLVVEKTGEVFPGLVVCGMSVSTVFGVPRMGPTFSGMLYSGRKAAVEVKKIIKKIEVNSVESVEKEEVVI